MHKSEALKAAPPVAVSGAELMGYSVSDLVLWATLIYVCVAAGLALTRWYFLVKYHKPGE